MKTHALITSEILAQRRGGRPFILDKSLAVLIASVALMGSKAMAQTSSGWRGDGATNIWSNAANWDNGAPGGNVRNLFFGNGWVGNPAGNNFVTANNDIVGYAGFRITFEDTALAVDPSFTITGNGFTLFDFFNGSTQAPRIENDSTSLQTFNLSGTLTLSNSTTTFAEINPVNGDLLFSSTTPIALGTNTQLRIFGNNGKTVTFNGVISGSGAGNSVAINQNSNVVYGAANTYVGDTFVNAGKLQFAAGGSANNSAIRIGDTAGTANAEVDLTPLAGGLTLSSTFNSRSGSSGAAIIASQNTSNANTLSGHIALDKAMLITQAAGGTLNITQAHTDGATNGTGTDIKGNTLTLNAAGTGAIAISGQIYNSTGAGIVLLNGAGTVTFSGANTYLGDTFVNAGRLQFAQGGSALSSAIRVGDTSGAASAELSIVDPDGGTTVASLINVRSGSSGVKTISATNTSGTNTSSGSVFLDADAAVATTLGGTLAFTGTTFDLKNQTLTVGGAGTVTINGALQNSTGAGKIIMNGAGTLQLTGAGVTYQGATTVNGGKLTLQDTTAFASAITVNGGGTLSAVRTTLGGAGRSPIMANAVTLAGGTLSIDNAGTGLGGGWTTFGVANGLTGSGTININSGVFSRDNTVANAINTSATVNVAAGAFFGAGRGGNSTIGALNGAGVVSTLWAGSNAGSITIGNGGGSGVFSGTLDGNGTNGTDFTQQGGMLSVIKTGGGTQALSGVNTYTGTTTINGGTLTLSGGAAIVDTGAVILANAVGVILNLAGSETIGSITGGGSSGGDVSLNGNTLTVGADNTSPAAFAGTIGGTGGLTKTGTGTLTLSGAGSNTYSGTTTITNGTTVLGKTGGAVAISGPVTFGTGSNTINPNLRMAADNQFGSAVTMTFLNLAGGYTRFDLQGTIQTVAGVQDTIGAGVIQNEKQGGGGTAAAGTLTINNGANFSYNGYVRDEDDGGHVFKLNLAKSGGGTQILSGGNITYQGTTTVSNGTLELQTTPNFASATTVNGGTLRLNNTATVTGTAFSVNVGTTGTLNFATNNTAVDANRFQGAITGTGLIVKEGAGWYHIQGGAMANFAGTINVMEGRFGNAFNTSVWTNSTADAFVAPGAELDLRTDDIVLDQLTGTGNVVNTFFAGETNTLTVGVANGSSTFDGQIRGSQVGANNASIDAGVTAVRKVGSGTFTLTNAGSNYTGPTTVDTGLLVMQSTRLVAGAKTVNVGGTLEINSEVPFASRWNNSGTISGGGIINKTGSGVFGTTGAVNFSGTINILDGRIHNDSVTGNWTGSTADVNIGATGVLDLRANDMYVDELNGTGEIWNSHPAGGGDVLFVGVANGSSSYDGIIMGNGSQAADNPNGAVLSLTKQGTGTFTITGGSNIYAGPTTVNNGVLRIGGGNDRLPIGTSLVVNGGATFGGTFDLNGLDQTVAGISGAAGAVAGSITSTTGPALLTANVAGANLFTTAANIVDGGANVVSLTKLGTGTQGLAGANTYSGATLISEGALSHGSATAFSPNSNLQLNGGVIEAGFGPLSLNTGTGGGAVQWLTHGGFAAVGAPRDITLNGGAPLTWSVNNFVGDGVKLLFGSVTGDNTATLTNDVNLGGANRTVEIVPGPASVEGALGGTISNGTLTVRGTQGTLALTGQATSNVVVDNTVTGSTNFMSLLLNRAGGDAIAGGLQIGATDNGQFATVRLGSSEQIADTSTVSFGAIGGSWSYLNLYGFDETIAGLSRLPGKDGGVVQLVEADASPATNSTLTLYVPIGTQSYFGHVRDRGSGASTDPGGNGRLGFVKDGAGTQEITTWNAQVWTGPTAVNNGTLRIALGGAVTGNATLSSSTNVVPGATLDFTNAANGNAWTFDGALTGAGNVVKSGRGIVTLTGAGLANNGPTTVNSGILRLLDTTYASATTVNAGAYVEEFRSGGSGALTANISGAGGFIKNGDGETTVVSALGTAETVVRRGTLTLTGDNLLPATGTVAVSGHVTPTLKLNGTTQTIGGLAASRDVNAHVVGGSAVTSALEVNIGAGQQTVFGGTLGGTGTDEDNVLLNKSGAGTLVLNGASTHTGGTIISAGTLQLGASTTMPVNLAALGIWLDGADPDANGIAPADGAPISTWKNKGALGATGDFSAAAGFEPSYGATGAGLMNGNATVRFTADAVSGFGAQANYDKLTNPIDLGVGPGTIIVAGRYAGASADERKRLVSALNNNWLLGWWNNGENTAYYQNGFAPGTSAPSTDAHVYSAVMRGDGIGETYSESAKLGSLGNAVGPNGLALGGGANYATQYTENSTGDVGELIIVKGLLTDADRAAIEAYLARKWAGFVPVNPLPITGAVTLTDTGATLAVNGVTQTVGSINGVAGSSITLGGGSLSAGNDGGTSAFAGVISGPGTLAKVGSGAWTLSGPLSMTTLIADEGTLNVDRNAANADVIVNATANFNVDQTLNSLDIADGAIATVDGPAMAPAPFAGRAEIGGSLSAGAVPEPGSVALLFGGMLTLLGLRRRK